MLKPDARLSFDYFARSLNRLEEFASGITCRAHSLYRSAKKAIQNGVGGYFFRNIVQRTVKEWRVSSQANSHSLLFSVEPGKYGRVKIRYGVVKRPSRPHQDPCFEHARGHFQKLITCHRSTLHCWDSSGQDKQSDRRGVSPEAAQARARQVPAIQRPSSTMQ
jgi:hypothetical protein